MDYSKDKYVIRWLTGKADKTLEVYKNAMNLYVGFTKKTPEQLILEKWEDMKKEPIHQTDVAENRVRDFFKWLTTEYVSKRSRKPMAPASGKIICRGALASFYASNKVPLNFRRNDFKGATKAINATEKMRPEQIEKLAYYAPTSRDKAIIWCMFQGGMDVSTVCSLNWGHVQKEIEKPPMGAVMLRGLERKKEVGRRFTTLIYKTAIKHLKTYLVERAGEDYAKKLKYDEPLFVGKFGGRHNTVYIQRMMREIAPKSGIANARALHADINPLRPHALRASFSNQMALAGATPHIIDYMMGHKLMYDTAYFGGEQGLRESYVKYAEQCLEPKGLTPQMEKTVAKQQEAIVNLQLELTETKKNMAPFIEAYKKLSREVGEEDAGIVLQMLLERGAVETIGAKEVKLRKEKAEIEEE